MPAKNESVALFFISVGKPKGLRRGRYPQKTLFFFFLSIDFFPRRV